MFYKDHNIIDDVFPGLSDLYRAHEKMRTEAALKNLMLKCDEFLGWEPDEEAVRETKHLSESVGDIEKAIQEIMPGWSFEPKKIIEKVSRLSLKTQGSMLETNEEWLFEKVDFLEEPEMECSHRKGNAVFDHDGEDAMNEVGEADSEKLSTILLKLKVHKLKPYYSTAPELITTDGQSWYLRIESPDGFLYSEGYNAWPKGFDELCEFLSGVCNGEE